MKTFFPVHLTHEGRALRLALLILFALLLPAWTAPVQAQAPVSFSELQVDLWPEYDQPEMLVIYRMTLGSGVTLPAEVTIRIPRAAGQPYSLAMQEVDGQLYNLAYTSRTEGDWIAVTFTTAVPVNQLEYYDPGLTRQDDRRSFLYQWPADHAVERMIVRVQQPTGAEDFTTAPPMGAPVTGGDGLQYFVQDLGRVDAGMSFQLRVNYTREGDVLTSESLLQPVQPNQPIQSGSIAGQNWWHSLNGSWPIIAAVLGLALVLIGVVWRTLGRSRPRPAAAGPKLPAAARRKKVRRTPPPAAAEDEVVYCTRCGKRASPGDVFCRSCGTRLRTP